ncbi:MAG: hypothetical protein A2161_07865, partial [Candidatus Schekmanbacteria bacterium RBG_13_48_7]
MKINKIKKILLIESNNMPKWIGNTVPIEIHLPPIALMYLASYARINHPDLEFKIIESSLDTPGEEQLVKVIREFQPDIIGIRSILFFFEELQKILRIIKSCADALIIVGGPIVQPLKRQLLQKCPEIDIAVRGEGESAFSAILTGESIRGIPGVLYRDKENIIDTGEGTEIRNIDSIPFPAYDLIDVKEYGKHLSYCYNYRLQGLLLTSRGCVHDCTFCFNHWKQLRLRSAENVFIEIVELNNRYNIQDFYIIDDIFNINRERSVSLFNKIIKSGLKIKIYFANGIRIDAVDERFIDTAIEAGAIWFTYAIETANIELQKMIRKKIHLKKAAKLIAHTQNCGVAVNISTMYGFPFETPDKAQETIDWLETLPKTPILPYYFCLRIFPGCEIQKQAEAAGWPAD